MTLSVSRSRDSGCPGLDLVEVLLNIEPGRGVRFRWDGGQSRSDQDHDRLNCGRWGHGLLKVRPTNGVAMDPALVATALSATNSAFKLLAEVRKLTGGEKGRLPEELTRLLLLETEYNLALLDVVRKAKGVPKDDHRFFAYAEALRLDAISAFLIEWREVNERFEFSFPFDRAKEWASIASGEEKADMSASMLGVARYIQVRGSALKALSTIDLEVRRGLNLPLRLRNLHKALLLLRRALLEYPALLFLEAR